MKHVDPFAPTRGAVPHLRGWYDLSIDPGVNTGWALFGESTLLVACGAGGPPFEAPPVLNRVVIELPQVYPGDPVPPQDLITLSFQAGQYARAGVVRTAQVSVVFPHAWKGNLPKKVCAARVRGHLSPDERMIVDKLEPGVPAGQMHNVMDAIGIGLFAFRKVRI